jgi:sugar (pentulose or hexulose) kinase
MTAAPPPSVLAFDLGTSDPKAVVVDVERRVLGTATG